MRRLIKVLPKVLLGIAIVACMGWSLWWYAGAQAHRAGFQAWLAQQRERGWQADAAEIEVTGFPTEFRLAARDLALADPAASALGNRCNGGRLAGSSTAG